MGGEEVIAVWWLGVSIPLDGISGGPKGTQKLKLMSQVYHKYVWFELFSCHTGCFNLTFKVAGSNNYLMQIYFKLEKNK